MKYALTLLFGALLFCTPLCAVPKNVIQGELTMLDDLIKTTENQLAVQKKLKLSIQEYAELQSKSLENSDDLDLLYRMAKKALEVQQMIKENYLTQMFSPEFLSELAIVSKPAAKKTIPKP